MAGGGGRGLSQLERRCSGAIVGLRSASQDRRRRTAAGGCCLGCCAGFTGEDSGDGGVTFFLVGEGGCVGAEACAALFLAVRRFRWWLRWYGEMRRRRPAMHPMLRLVAVEHVVGDARRWAGSGCGGGCGCIALCVRCADC